MAARPVPRDLAASVRARLHNVAKARNVELQLVLSEFAVERLLYRLGVSSHAIVSDPKTWRPVLLEVL